MKSRGKEPHSNLSEDLSAAQRCKDDRMNGAAMKWREGKQKVSCCCPCSHVETVIWALTSSEILKNVTLLRSLKTSSQHTLCWPYVFDVQFRPHLLLALLLNSIFCPSWQLLKNASLHLFKFCKTTGGRGPIPHSPPRDLRFWSHGPCLLPSCHLPSCFQRAALPRRQGNPHRGGKEVKEISFSGKEAHSFYLMYSVYTVSPASSQERPLFGDCQ